LRKGYTVIGKAQSDFLVTGHRAEELIADLQGELAGLQGRKSGALTITASDAMVQAVTRLEEQHGRGVSCGVEVGYPALDYMLSGLQRGELILLAARPSMGKTSLMMNMAVNAAKRGTGVYVFSIEMTAREIGHRMIFSEASIDGNIGRQGNLTDQQMTEVGRAASRLSGLPLWINDRSRKLYDIISVIKREATINKIDLVCLDYIQLVRTNLHGKSRNEEVGFISAELKALAKELNVPVLALSQLSRVNETGAAPRPTLNALRDSGSLEQDADVVVFIHSDEYYTRFLSGEKDISEWLSDLIVAKQRNGPTGTVKTRYMRQFTRFFPVDMVRESAGQAANIYN
jgi:replicative DNA helicase